MTKETVWGLPLPPFFLAGVIVLLLCWEDSNLFFTVTVIYMIYCICSQGRTNVDIFKRKKSHGTALHKMTMKLRHGKCGDIRSRESCVVLQLNDC